jgi:hypothetical protein
MRHHSSDNPGLCFVSSMQGLQVLVLMLGIGLLMYHKKAN